MKKRNVKTFISNLHIRIGGCEKRAELLWHNNFGIPVVVYGFNWFQVKGNLSKKMYLKPVDAGDRIYFKVCENREGCEYVLSDEVLDGYSNHPIIKYPNGSNVYLCIKSEGVKEEVEKKEKVEEGEVKEKVEEKEEKTEK